LRRPGPVVPSVLQVDPGRLLDDGQEIPERLDPEVVVAPGPSGGFPALLVLDPFGYPAVPPGPPGCRRLVNGSARTGKASVSSVVSLVDEARRACPTALSPLMSFRGYKGWQRLQLVDRQNCRGLSSRAGRRRDREIVRRDGLWCISYWTVTLVTTTCSPYTWPPSTSMSSA
jgi:hypothetical protein